MSLKKNLKDKILNSPQKELFFFDESRFGTHSNLGHGWFKKGEREAVKVKLGFDNFYLYSAINVNTGVDVSYLMPSINTQTMNEFLKMMCKELEGKEIIIVMDGAGWHRSKSLEIPKNIEIMYLPPYSPELNPVERFWAYIKNHVIKNKLYNSLNDLKEALCNFLQNISFEQTLKTCSINYLTSLN